MPGRVRLDSFKGIVTGELRAVLPVLLFGGENHGRQRETTTIERRTGPIPSFFITID
jgi:hypothetical protein